MDAARLLLSVTALDHSAAFDHEILIEFVSTTVSMWLGSELSWIPSF